MITQNQVDGLRSELEQLRSTLVRDRRAASVQIDALIDRATNLRNQAEGTGYEPSIQAVHDLLGSLRRGVRAQMGLNSKGLR